LTLSTAIVWSIPAFVHGYALIIQVRLVFNELNAFILLIRQNK